MPRHALPHGLLLIVLAVSLLAACQSEEQEPTPTSVSPTATAVRAEATATPAMTPTATVTAAMGALLSPGPTFGNVEQFFFLNGSDLWQAQSNGRVVRVTRDLDLGPWAMAPDGSRAIAVIRRVENTLPTEEIRIIRGDGLLSLPLYGPLPTSGVDARPTIVALDWSWDQTKLVVLFDDGAVGVLPVPDNEDQYPVAMERIVQAGNVNPGRKAAWSLSSNGFAYIAGERGESRLVVVPLGDEPQEIAPDVATRAFAWLPGRGRLAFVERAGGTGREMPGSIFTMAADGTSRELLLSAGQFAPAALVMSLRASPDGRFIAFTVFVPGPQGTPTFQSLWALNIDSGELVNIPVATGYRVADIWWAAQGLSWRAVSLDAPAADDPTQYRGTGAFLIQRYDDASGTSTTIFSAGSAR